MSMKNNVGFSFFGFLRKSFLGSLYRVGSSFTLDALTLGLASGDLQGFFEDLDPLKLLRVAAYVVGINFLDYKFDLTDKFDNYICSLKN